MLPLSVTYVMTSRCVEGRRQNASIILVLYSGNNSKSWILVFAIKKTNSKSWILVFIEFCDKKKIVL
jgi:hypothetical protein